MSEFIFWSRGALRRDQIRSVFPAVDGNFVVDCGGQLITVPAAEFEALCHQLRVGLAPTPVTAGPKTPERHAFPWHFLHVFAPPSRWREINAAAGVDATETDGRGRYATKAAIRRAADALHADGAGPLEIAHAELHAY